MKLAFNRNPTQKNLMQRVSQSWGENTSGCLQWSVVVSFRLIKLETLGLIITRYLGCWPPTKMVFLKVVRGTFENVAF